MKKLLKTICLCLTAAFFLLSVLGGCGASGNTPENSTTAKGSTESAATTAAETEKKGIQLDPNKQVKLRFFTSSSVSKAELDQSLPEFNKKYPNIAVETVLITGGGAAFDTGLKTAIVAGEQVDVIEVNTNILERANAGNMYIPFDDLIKKDGLDVAKDYGDFYKPFQVGGLIYAMPKYIAPAGVWYNKKHFDEAGIPYPTPDWTWEEFLDTAKKLTQKDASGKITRYGFYEWFFNNDGTYSSISNTALQAGWQLLKEDGSLNLDDPTFRKVVEFFYNASMVDKSMPDLATITAEKWHYAYDMYKGRWSMLIGGRNLGMFFNTHIVNGQLSAEEDAAGIYQPAYLPRWDKNSPSKQAVDVVYGDSIGKTAKFLEEAYTFIKWHTTESLVLAAKVAPRVPAAKNVDFTSLFDSWSHHKDKDGNLVKGKERTELFKVVVDPEIKPLFADVTAKYPYSTMIIGELNKELSLLFTGAKDIDKAIADAKAAAQKIIDKEKK